KAICSPFDMRLRLAALSFFAFCVVETAQQPVHRASLGGDQTLSVDVERVNVLFTVAGRRGKPITNLKRDDFSVFEDDRLQNISNFSAEMDLPLNIAFLIDTSGSIWGKLRFEREAAARFFYSALRPGKDKASILTFDSEMTLLQNYTDDPAILTASMQRLISGGSTALYQAVSEAVTERLAGQTGRRVVIIVSDGVDNSSHISLERTLEVAQKNDVVIYAV